MGKTYKDDSRNKYEHLRKNHNRKVKVNLNKKKYDSSFEEDYEDEHIRKKVH